MDFYSDLAAVTGESFINRIIDNLKNHMMQTSAIICVTDIHTRTLSDGIQTLEYLD
jgi:hypothetical protein